MFREGCRMAILDEQCFVFLACAACCCGSVEKWEREPRVQAGRRSRYGNTTVKAQRQGPRSTVVRMQRKTRVDR